MPERSGVLRVLSRVLRFGVGAVVLAAGLGVYVILWQTRPEPARRAFEERVLTVRALAVTPTVVPRVWEGYGTARAMDAADVAAQVSARVIERPRRIEPGASVAAGEVLLRLDPTDFQERAAALRETIGSWEAQLLGLGVEQRRLGDQLELAQQEAEIEQRELDRMLEAAGMGAGAQTEIERRRSSLARSQREISQLQQRLETIPAERQRVEALLGSERANLRAAEENLARATIKAPHDGVLQRVDVRVGETVMAGRVVARVVDLTRIEVPLRVPIAALSTVAVGAPAELRTDTPGPGASAPTWTGRVVRIAPEADPATRTATVFIEVEQPMAALAGATGRRPLLPGQFVVGQIETFSTEPRVLVPRRALDGDRVFVAHPEEGERCRVRSVEVRVEHYLRQRIERLDPHETQWAVVESGLAPGERVILTSLDDLAEGMLVRLEGAAETAAGPASPAGSGS